MIVRPAGSVKRFALRFVRRRDDYNRRRRSAVGTRRADRLPERCFRPIGGGATDGVSLDRARFERMVEAYYDMWGWQPVSGEPRPGALYELGLEWAVR
jgi:aldehyde:ferredoxin oxidoreductase